MDEFDKFQGLPRFDRQAGTPGVSPTIIFITKPELLDLYSNLRYRFTTERLCVVSSELNEISKQMAEAARKEAAAAAAKIAEYNASLTNRQALRKLERKNKRKELKRRSST